MVDNDSQVSAENDSPDVNLNVVEAERSRILLRIARYRRNAVAYRVLNVVLFDLFKIGGPLASAVLSLHLILEAAGDGFLNLPGAIGLAVLPVAMNTLDGLLKPTRRKRLAFHTYIQLDTIATRLRLPKAADAAGMAAEIREANLALAEVLENHNNRGWGVEQDPSPVGHGSPHGFLSP